MKQDFFLAFLATWRFKKGARCVPLQRSCLKHDFPGFEVNDFHRWPSSIILYPSSFGLIFRSLLFRAVPIMLGENPGKRRANRTWRTDTLSKEKCASS